MNKKIVLGSCFCIILITFAIILFFTSKSEMLVINSDISNNLYNIFPMRNSKFPYDVEFYSIESLFSKEFLDNVKLKIKARIEDNIVKYLVYDLNNGSMFEKLSSNIKELDNIYSVSNIQSRVPKIIYKDQKVHICSAKVGEQNYCFRQESPKYDSWLILSTTPHKWQFTEKMQP